MIGFFEDDMSDILTTFYVYNNDDIAQAEQHNEQLASQLENELQSLSVSEVIPEPMVPEPVVIFTMQNSGHILEWINDNIANIEDQVESRISEQQLHDFYQHLDQITPDNAIDYLPLSDRYPCPNDYDKSYWQSISKYLKLLDTLIVRVNYTKQSLFVVNYFS